MNDFGGYRWKLRKETLGYPSGGCHVVGWINITMIKLFSTAICRIIGRPYSTTKGALHGCIKEDAILSRVNVYSTAIIEYYQYRNR